MVFIRFSENLGAKKSNFLHRSPKKDATLVHQTNTKICVLLEHSNPIPLGRDSMLRPEEMESFACTKGKR
jgi:hypothetical protein